MDHNNGNGNSATPWRQSVESRLGQFHSDIWRVHDSIDRKIEERFNLLDYKGGKADEKFEVTSRAIDQKIDSSMGGLDHKVDQRLGTLDQRVDAEFTTLHQKLEGLHRKLNVVIILLLLWGVGFLANSLRSLPVLTVATQAQTQAPSPQQTEPASQTPAATPAPSPAPAATEATPTPTPTP